MPPKSEAAGKKTIINNVSGFNWISYFSENGFKSCVQVSSLPSSPLADRWNQSVKQDMDVEVANGSGDTFWIASVLKKLGYYMHLRYLGSVYQGQDFCLPVFDPRIHHLGFSDLNSKIVSPPPHIRKTHDAKVWSRILSEHKERSDRKTLPENFALLLKRSKKCRLKRQMKLEVIDKDCPSTVRLAHVMLRKSGRMRLKYEAIDGESTSDFWCHENSPLIHPIGWAQLIGHKLNASDEYAEESMLRAMDGSFREDEASWKLFPPVKRIQSAKNESVTCFASGMKLEAIHPFRTSRICVATVTKVLRCDYMMISIDGIESPDDSDCFCCHASSPYIFHAGFCRENEIKLSTPPKYSKKFDWSEYLKATKSTAAPAHLFHRETPSHRIKKNFLLEAADLTEPKLIRVASVARVIGRLLRIHFTGLDDKLDQWMDCESPDLYPVGWCAMNDYLLTPPPGYECPASQADESYTSSPNKESSSQPPLKRRKIIIQARETPPVSESPEKTSDSPDTCASSKSSLPPAPEGEGEEMSIEPAPLPNDPRSWSVDDVKRFLVENHFSHLAQTFVDSGIDGWKLLELTYDELAALSGHKMGPAVKINALIQSLCDPRR